MSIIEVSAQKLPNVTFIRQSSKRVSLYHSIELPCENTEPIILAYVARFGVIDSMLEKYLDDFSPLTQLVSESEFKNLALSDYTGHLYGNLQKPAPGGLINPVTKNEYHLVAVSGNMVAGVRFFFQREYTPVYALMRVRLELRKTSDLPNLKTEASEGHSRASAYLASLANLAPVPEPYQDPNKVKIRHKN